MERPMGKCRGFIFDLDGVIVDTAKYHYLAWKAMADELGIHFTRADNERLKGVSRRASLDIILEIGNLAMTEEDKEASCIKKNNLYVRYIQNLEKHEILPGVEAFITAARQKGLKVALGSASRNSSLILDRLGIRALFDVVVDGTIVHEAKPNPQVFLTAAAMLGLEADECIVFEDSIAGIEAAHNGGMTAIGIGSSDVLHYADAVVPGFEALVVEEVMMLAAHEKKRT